MEILFGWFILAIVIGAVAPSKGRSGFGWFLLALLISPLFAGIILAIVPSLTKEPRVGRGYRACPYCAEPVRKEAKLCPHCRSPLVPPSTGPSPTTSPSVSQLPSLPPPPPRPMSQRAALVGLGFVSTLVILFVVLPYVVPRPHTAARTQDVVSSSTPTPKAELARLAPSAPAPSKRLEIDAEMLAALKMQRKACQVSLRNLVSSGTITSIAKSPTELWVYYDEGRWTSLSVDEQHAAGLTIYCASMPKDGKHVVRLRGMHEGGILGSVVNGNWVDG